METSYNRPIIGKVSILTNSSHQVPAGTVTMFKDTPNADSRGSQGGALLAADESTFEQGRIPAGENYALLGLELSISSVPDNTSGLALTDDQRAYLAHNGLVYLQINDQETPIGTIAQYLSPRQPGVHVPARAFVTPIVIGENSKFWLSVKFPRAIAGFPNALYIDIHASLANQRIAKAAARV